MVAFRVRPGSHQHNRFFMLPAGEIRVAEDLFEPARRYVPLPFGRGLRRHQNVMRPRPSGPTVEVLPLQKGINWPPTVEGEGVRFDPEEKNRRRRRCDFAHRGRERATLTQRFQTRMIDVNEPNPGSDNTGENDSQRRIRNLAYKPRRFAEHALAGTTQEN